MNMLDRRAEAFAPEPAENVAELVRDEQGQRESEPRPASPVMSHNEWDPLEEVIVGRLEGATIPSNHVTVTFNVPRLTARLYRVVAGRHFPKWMVRLAQRQLDGFIALLEGEGVRVRRPEPIDFRRPYRTRHWRSRG